MESPISVSCIQESWAHEGIEMSQFFLPNYTMIFENRRLSTHGGLIIIHDDFAYKELNKEIIILQTYLKVNLLKYGEDKRISKIHNW